MLLKVLASFVRVSPGSSFLSLLLTQSMVGNLAFLLVHLPSPVFLAVQRWLGTCLDEVALKGTPIGDPFLLYKDKPHIRIHHI